MKENIKRLFFVEDVLNLEVNDGSFLEIGIGCEFETTKENIISIINSCCGDYDIVCDDMIGKYLIKIASYKDGLYLELHKTHDYAERCHGNEDETFEESIVLCEGNKEKQIKFLESIPTILNN